MRRYLGMGLNRALESETGEQRRETEPAVIALVDRRGRRLLVPTYSVPSRHRRHATQGQTSIAQVPQADYTSGTIH